MQGEGGEGNEEEIQELEKKVEGHRETIEQLRKEMAKLGKK